MTLRKLIPVWRTITHITVNDPIKMRNRGIVHRAELHIEKTWLGIGGLVKEHSSVFCYSPTGTYWQYNSEQSSDYVTDALNKRIEAAAFEKQYKAAQVDSAFDTLQGP